MQQIILFGDPAAVSAFCLDGRQIRLEQLCGMSLAGAGAAGCLQGLLSVATDSGALDTASWRCGRVRRRKHACSFRLTSPDRGLAVETLWSADPRSGIVSRCDRLTNTSRKPVVIRRCLGRLALPPGAYEVYAQHSRWCGENQGAWLPAQVADLRLGNASGRTTQGNTPYACLRDTATRGGLVLHVLPEGNWTMRFGRYAAGDQPPAILVELGLSDENLRLELKPGASLRLPELRFQPLPEGEPRLAAPAWHRHVLARDFAGAKTSAPVVYNTWFDQFECLEPARLHSQLAAARSIGCEVFVVDAGWYGNGAGDWFAQAGDWSEKRGAAFKGRMREFAEAVRAAGMGFGLWMEPERFGPAAPVRRRHPEWFVPVGALARIRPELPAARRYLRREIGRLVERYQLAWMKIDFNFELGVDPSGSELSRYYAAWYGLLDEIRAAYPRTFFEGCASGGLRCDLNALRYCDGHFLSDTVDPVDAVRISEGAFLRLPPGRITRWLALRSAGKVVRYGVPPEQTPVSPLVPGGAVWEPAATVDLDFAILAALPGMLGFSGDLASLPPEQLRRLRETVRFVKTWRRFITGSVAHLLTPVGTLVARTGWVVFQLQQPAGGTSLLFAYRLGAAAPALRVRLCGLNPAQRYALEWGFERTRTPLPRTGRSLMENGLLLELPFVTSPRGSRALLAIVRPARRHS